MKKYNILAVLAVSAAVMTACADTDIDNITVGKPQSIADYEYLDAYADLKSYIDRTAHPAFRLGTGVLASDYNKKSLVYLLTNNNFDIMTAGNAMKYASVVGDKGAMDFSTVSEFVDNARNAGMDIYGHTLCWHEQQNTKWLNSLLKDKELEVDPGQKNEVVDYTMDYSGASSYNFWAPDEVKENISVNKDEGCLDVVNGAAIENWQFQYHVADGLPVVKDNAYKLKVMVRGTGEGTIGGKVGDWGAGAEFNLPFSTEWKEVVFNFTAQADNGFVLFQSGQFVGTIQIKYVEITHMESPSVKVYESLVDNGDAEGDATGSFFAVEGSGLQPARIVDDPYGDGHVYEVSLPASPSTAWDAQFFIKSDIALKEDDRVRVSFRYRCTDTRSIDTQAHGEPTDYHFWSFIGTLSASDEWKEHSWTGAITSDHAGTNGCHSIAFNLSSIGTSGTFYIDDIKFEIERSANSIPLTPEEKAAILDAEMERWVKGMMDATMGYVKVWDVVNEPLSGGGGQRYDLQHAASDPSAANKFYWQDYLGDNYVRVPVKYARKYFEENGGDPADLKLFINDYNLESDWDDNKKLRSLIEWIDQWESDGETKIDGIGTQMHINYYMNPVTQQSKEEHIVKMFRLMAATGKLVRITELDMGLCDENGNDVPTSEVTLEQHKLMADHYRFIIRKYLEIVPVEQQFGITLWCQTDSPEGSGWRPGQPTGIWDLGFNRKPAYAGIADGLAEKE